MQNPEGKAKGRAKDQTPLEDTLDVIGNNISDSASDSGAVDNSAAMDNDYLKLRRLVLGNEYSDAINRLITKEDDVNRVVSVLPQALKKSSQHELGEALAPIVDQAIGKSIDQNPSRITNILFPIMGPAIRKAVSSALAEMVQTLNTLLEQSLSFGSLRWRIQAWRAGLPYAKYVLLQTIQYRVEQVFLVHKETGLLLNSVTATEVETQDPELVSSMLTAISDFVSDSFSGSQENLERVRFGDLELLLYVGPQAILAIAVRGSASDELFEKAHTVIEDIHATYVQALEHFDGDRDEFEATEPLLSECLLSQKVSQKAKQKPWLAAILILAFFAYLIYQSINSWQLNQQFKQLEAVVNNQVGYVVISTKREGNQLYVKALRSPESQTVDELKSSLSTPSDLTLNIDANVVHFGPLPKPVIKDKTRDKVLQELINKVQNTTFYFDTGEVNLTETELLKIPELINNLAELERLVGDDNLQVVLIGFADSSGSSLINNKVSQERAEEIKSLLIANKVSSKIIVTWGVGHLDRETIAENIQRRVTLQVLQTSNNIQLSEAAADKELHMHFNQEGEQL
jgi:outer membrane protein OmpA-like peptidoglycan-associated protein